MTAAREEREWLTRKQRIARADARHFRVGVVEWTVYEAEGPCLIFESEKIARRVRDVPSRWRDLSDEELIALSWSR